jgi:molecular chaperone GrpE
VDDSKEALVARFRACLDELDSDLDDAQVPDLFTLLAELTALKSEVKLESRQVKNALDQFRGLFDTLQQTNDRLSAELARRQNLEREVADGAERELLLELTELRDRLQTGYLHVTRYRPGWLARRGGAKAFVAGMADGLAMNLRRLDESLARREVRPIEALGRRFDPRTMSAVEITADPARAAGEVVSEVRTGYLRGNELLRTAEVVVNKIEDQAS